MDTFKHSAKHTLRQLADSAALTLLFVGGYILLSVA